MNNELSGEEYRDTGELPQEVVARLPPGSGVGDYVLDVYQFKTGTKWRCALRHVGCVWRGLCCRGSG